MSTILCNARCLAARSGPSGAATPVRRSRFRNHAGRSVASRRTPLGRLRPAFTLTEVVVSAAIMAILATAVTSTLIIASHALDGGEGPLHELRTAAGTVDRLAEDLAYALSLPTATATAIEVTVSDRDGDLAPESIRYAWSGTPGDPLTRQINGGTAIVVARDVREFELSYALENVTTKTDEEATTSGEIALFRFEDADGASMFKVLQTSWIGQYFKPALPENAVSWSITRVKFMAQAAHPVDGTSLVVLSEAACTGVPAGTALTQQTMEESILGSTHTWVEFAFKDLADLRPESGVSLVIQHVKGAQACCIPYKDVSPALTDGMLIRTNDGGKSWAAAATQSMPFVVFGTVTTVGSTTLQSGTLRWVNVRLRTGDEPASAAEGSVLIQNRPEVTVE